MSRLCIVSLMLLLLTFPVYATDVTLEIDMDNMIKTHNKNILGSGYDSGGVLSELFMERSDSSEISPDYISFMKEKKFPVPLMRIGGNHANKYEFKDNIGKMSERLGRLNFGIGEFIKSTLLVDSTTDFLIVLNFKTDTAQDNADLARFLTLQPDDENAIGLDGVNYAQKRVDSGVEYPVTNVIFELGNEIDWDDGGANSLYAMQVDEYIVECKARMAAIRAVYPDAKFAAQGLTNVWSTQNPSANVWESEVINQLGVQTEYFKPVDYLAVHYYYGGYSMSKVFTAIDNTISLIESAGQSNRLKLLITEHAEWPNESTNSHFIGTSSLHGTLWTADFYNQCQNRAVIEGAAYYSFNGGVFNSDNSPQTAWRIVSKSANGAYSLSGIGELYKLLYQNAGIYVVKSTVNTPDLSGRISASASKTENGDLRIVIVNKNIENNKDSGNGIEYTLSLAINNAHSNMYLKKRITLTADSLSTDNTFENQNAFTITETVPDTLETVSNITIPAYSVTILHLGSELYTENIIDEIGITNTVAAKYGQEVNNAEKKVDVSCSFGSHDDAIRCAYMVLKKGVALDEYSPEDIFAMGQFVSIGLSQDFSFYMPNGAEAGEYMLTVTGNYNGVAHTATEYFYYNNSIMRAVPLENIRLINPAVQADIPVAINSSISLSADAKSYVPDGRPFTFAVYKGDKSAGITTDDTPLHIGQVQVNNSSVVYNFTMPQSAESTLYTVLCSYNQHDGEEAEKQSMLFVYQNPDDIDVFPLTMEGTPMYDNGEILTIQNLSSASDITVNINNSSFETIKGAMVFACYDMNGKLIYSTVDNVMDYVYGTNNRTIDLKDSISNAIFCKIFILSNCETIKPLMQFYVID